MKTRLLIIALPCLLFGACNNSGKNSANDKKADSNAATHRDSLLMAAKKNHIQDSIEDAKAAADTNKKVDTNKSKN